ncbi:MAG TPA: YIP1 family protein [Sandaracinaceae bacterium LLY-WYZ-13_1]|nr:YIP1 family protein [Sandaracinaceae bacterium LLY-WYZ-13_1]
MKRREICDGCAAQGLGRPIPWERREEHGLFEAFWRTGRLASRSPTAFFRTPTTVESPLSAVAHGVVSFTVGLLLSYLVAGLLVMLGGGATALFVRHEGGELLGAALGMYGCAIAGMSPVALLFGPANALMGLVFAAAAAHGTLALFGKTGARFEDTLRAVCYANSPYVWSWVPVLGSLTWFWMLGIEVVALRETHGCGADWAALAALAWRVTLFVVAIGSYAILFGAFFAFLQSR